MDKEEAIKKLSERWPNADYLRSEFSGLIALLGGEFEKDKFNVYVQKEGIVVSRPLVRGIEGEKDSTIGIIGLGGYSFDTGENIEIMTVLEKRLYANVGGRHGSGENWSRLEKYGSIIAPAGTILNLEVKVGDTFVFYLCQYKPKK